MAAKCSSTSGPLGSAIRRTSFFGVKLADRSFGLHPAVVTVTNDEDETTRGGGA